MSADAIPEQTEDDRFFQRIAEDDTARIHRSDRLRDDFLEGFRLFDEVGPAIVIGGSIHPKEGSFEYEAARSISRRLAEAGYATITGASAGGGMMEAANRGALEGGGTSVACTIQGPTPTVVDQYVGTHIEFRYYTTRRAMFMKYADAFVIMPGGAGTSDRLLEAITLMQKRKVRPFPVILFGSAFWQGLVDWIRSSLVASGELREEDLANVHITDDADEVVRLVLAQG